MKRPLVIFALAQILGIIAASVFNSLYVLLTLSIAFLIFFILLIKNYKNYRLFLIGTIAFFLLGMYQLFFIGKSIEGKLQNFTDKNVTIDGFIDSEPDIKENKVSYVLKIVELTCDGIKSNPDAKVLFSTAKKGNNYFYSYGTRVMVNGKVTLPMGARNPGGFDFKRYLSQSGISATVFAQGNNVKAIEGSYANPLIKTGLTIRNRIVDVINKSLPVQQAGLLNGMLIGYRKGLSEEVQNAFSDAGLTHIMAVSGANIVFIVFPLSFIFKFLKFSRRLSNILIILILIIFVFVTGMEPSVLRAVIMATIVLLGQIIFREPDIYTSLSAASILMLAINPYTLFNIGFQLSFGATLSLVLFSSSIKSLINIKYLPEVLNDTLVATITAQLGVLAITVYYFNKISLIAIITNVVVVPLTGIITIVGFAMAIFGQVSITVSTLIGYINNFLLTFVLYTIKLSSQVPYASIKLITPRIIVVVLYYVLICYLLWLKPKYNLKVADKYIVALLAVGVVAIGVSVFYPAKMEVAFIDVGQGDSTFVKSTKGKCVLIDGGSDAKPETNIGENTIIPFLLDCGVDKLDAVVLTHGHEDHYNGLIPIMESFDIGKLILPDIENKEELKAVTLQAQERNIPIDYCSEGDKISLDKKTDFEVFFPLKGHSVSKSAVNNNSMVLKLNYGNVGIVFPGDIESEAEELIVEESRDIKAQVLKIAHHGSPGSTTQDFLDRVKPEVAVISVGKNNFGHPSKVVLDRLKGNGVKYYRTDESGALVLRTDGSKVWIKETLE